MPIAGCFDSSRWRLYQRDAYLSTGLYETWQGYYVSSVSSVKLLTSCISVVLTSIYTIPASYTLLLYMGINLRLQVPSYRGGLTYCCFLELAWDCFLCSSSTSASTDNGLFEDKGPTQTHWLCHVAGSAIYITWIAGVLASGFFSPDSKACSVNEANLIKDSKH